jgi:hypothetical protein
VAQHGAILAQSSGRGASVVTERRRSCRLGLTTDVERGLVQVRAVIVGSIETAAVVTSRLTTQLAAASGVEPDVHVTAVPVAEAREQRLRTEIVAPPRGAETRDASSFRLKAEAPSERSRGVAC